MTDADEKYWQEAKKGLEKISSSLQATRLHKIDFWEHITLVLITVVGFSVALFSQSDGPLNVFIYLALGLMLLSVVIGLLLIREDIDINQHNEFTSGVFSYNSWMVMERVEKGELNPQSEEHKGLVIANIIEGFKNIPTFNEKIFNKYAEDLANKYKGKLPFQQFLKETKGKNRWSDSVQMMFARHFHRIVDVFYLITFASLLLFFCGLLI